MTDKWEFSVRPDEQSNKDKAAVEAITIDDFITAARLCCICREPLVEWPLGVHNPDPVTADGACCDSCNEHIVIPAREAQR